LKSIRDQSYPNIELIVVDNYSSDDTVEIAKKYSCEVFQSKVLRSAARNYGARKAKGSFLFFLDGDQELTPEVIEKCAGKALNDQADAIMIPEKRVGDGFWTKCRALERLTYIGDPLVENARFYKKDVFEKLGGYDETLDAGEDKDLHARVEDAGYNVSSVNAVMWHLEGHVRLSDRVRKSYYYGKTYIRYARKQPKRAGIQLMPIRLNFVRKWRLLSDQPLYTVGMLFLKFVEYLAGIIGLASSRESLSAKREQR